MSNPAPTGKVGEAAPAVGSASDAAHFRRVLGHYPTGVAVITADHPTAGPVGMTVGSFTSVSLDPPLVAFFPMAGSTTFQRIAEAGVFCVNILGRHQEGLCRTFASRAPDKFEGVSWRPSPLGSPILDEVVAWIDGRITHVQDAGDHLAVYSEVVDLAVNEPTAPLMFFQGGYGRFSAMSVVARAEDDFAAQLQLADIARPHLEALSRQFGVEAHATSLIGDRLVQLAWVAATGSRFLGNKVGLRLPFAPPMGLLFVAWEDTATQDAWLAASDPAVRGVYRDDFARARAEHFHATLEHEELYRAEEIVYQMANGLQSVSADQQLYERLAAYTPASATTPPRLLSYTTPVFDRNGRVVLALAVQGITELSGEQLDACREALISAGRAVTQAIHGIAPR